MSSSDYLSDEEFVLIESSLTKLERRKVAVHLINRERVLHEEYHHLFTQMKLNPEKIFGAYTRMNETFNYSYQEKWNII